MIAMSANAAFLISWLTFTVLGVAAAVAAFVWAVRNRQFSDQDRARSLPLQSGIPEQSGRQRQPGAGGDDSREGS